MKKQLIALLLVSGCLAPAVRAGELAGYKFLITSVRTGDTEIFEVDPDMGDARNVTRRPSSEDRYPCWSPDGGQIAFTSNRALGTYNLFVCNADGSNVRQLTRETGTSVAYMPSWVGDRIVFGLHRDKPHGQHQVRRLGPEGPWRGARSVHFARRHSHRLYRPSARRRQRLRDECRRLQQASDRQGRESMGRHLSKLVARWKADRLFVQGG